LTWMDSCAVIFLFHWNPSTIGNEMVHHGHDITKEFMNIFFVTNL
jgi:hypothetical protein